jgi:hypothetical protein
MTEIDEILGVKAQSPPHLVDLTTLPQETAGTIVQKRSRTVIFIGIAFLFIALVLCIKVYGEKDPSKDFIGKWIRMGSSDVGIILFEDETFALTNFIRGIMYSPEHQRRIGLLFDTHGTGSVSGENFEGTLELDNSFLVLKTSNVTIYYERAK